jgi:DNA repair protein SbcD/Mre11
MRILHTADWHVGRRLGRHDRMQEHRDVLEEVARIADDEAVDLVLVSGDVFDRPSPTVDALSLGLHALQRLAEGRPVVVVAGNHDAPELFDALAPLLRDRGVHAIGSIQPPDKGGVLGPDELGVPAVVAGFPFLREGRVVDFMAETGRWYGQYAEKVAAITGAYNAALIERAGADLVPILVAHFMVSGVRIAHSERELHIGDAYAATAQAIPPGPQYVALGHIHAPQPVPGSPVPAEYAGSLLALDFGEAGETKRVVLVDAEPGQLATVRSAPLASGRPLVRAHGTWDEVAARAEELAGAYLDLTVAIGGADPELGRRAADTFPYLVRVRAERPTAERRVPRAPTERPSDVELYAEFVRTTTGADAPDELLDLLHDVLEEATDASA